MEFVGVMLSARVPNGPSPRRMTASNEHLARDSDELHGSTLVLDRIHAARR